VARHTCRTYPAMWVFFVLYIIFTNWSLLNLVTGIILDHLLKITYQDELEKVKEKELKHQRMVATLADLFLCTDSDNSETVDKDEFIAAMQDDSFVARLTELSIPVLEAQHLFDVLDIDGSGQITLPEFLDGFTRVAGVAKSKDLLQVHCDLTKHFRTLGKLLSTNTETWSAMLRLVRRQLAQQMRDIKAALPPRGLPPPSRKDPGGPSAGVPPPVTGRGCFRPRRRWHCRRCSP